VKGLHTVLASAYIREFLQTERCDKFSDLGQQRDAYKKFVGQEALTRIAEYKETLVDERKAAQAVMHYFTFDASVLAKSLTWPNWMLYHTVYRVERNLAFVGLGSSMYGDWKIAHR